MTLVETVVGIAILGTLLVAVLIASSRLTAQSARADQVLQATAVADTVMEQFWKDLDKLPHNGSGDVAGKKGWRWRTYVRSGGDNDNVLKETATEILLLEIFSEKSSDGKPAVSLEFLVPARQAATTTEPAP